MDFDAEGIKRVFDSLKRILARRNAVPTINVATVHQVSAGRSFSWSVVSSCFKRER
jgi:hypothetical protein